MAVFSIRRRGLVLSAGSEPSVSLRLAFGDGRYGRLLKMLARVELLILDDWGLSPLTPDQGNDLLEVLDDRHGRSPPPS